MRTSATAWREAGDRITGLAGDSDGSATKALTGVTGATGDAARKHWNGLVAPDGDLSSAAKGCHAAADRLEHGADQVGAAKVELVRELVNLAKNNDAAQQAASAGHPTALLGLDTAITGASANVAHLTNTLTSSVRLDSGLDVGATAPPVNANPGTHGGGGLLGGLVNTVGGAVDTAVGTVADATSSHGHGGGGGWGNNDSATGHGNHGAHGDNGGLVGGLVNTVADTATGTVGAVTDTVTGHGDQGGQGDQGNRGGQGDQGDHGGQGDRGRQGGDRGLVGDLVDTATGTVGAVAPAPIAAVGPAVTGPHLPPPVAGPVEPPRIDLAHGSQPGAPGSSGPIGNTGDTVAQSAATLLDRPSLPTEAQAPTQTTPQAPVAQAPAQAAPNAGFTAPPAATGPAPTPAAPAATANTGGVVGAPVRSDGQSSAVQRALDPRTPQPGTYSGAPQQTTQQPGTQQPGSHQQQQPGSHQQPGAAPTGKEAKKPEVAPGPELVAFFYGHLFPRSTVPKRSARPIEQVEQPEAETTATTGLRFPPQDHPRANLISTRWAQPQPSREPLGPDHPIVREITEGHDPQAGMHERDWDAKFIDETGHVWPPSELFPEGGYEAGRPEVLDAGTELDRFGTPEGRVLSTRGTKYTARSLPPDLLDQGYRRYVVRQPLPVWRTISAEWFGQPGGGTRYRTTFPVADLVALGYLMELT
jgi:hypothetical protein